MQSHRQSADNTTWWALRVLFGFVPIAAGLDKFFNLLTNWEAYLNPLATKVIPISPATFMHIVGVIEIAAGVVVLSHFTKFGAYVVSVWLVAIALNLLVMGRFLDVAVPDLGLRSRHSRWLSGRRCERKACLVSDSQVRRPFRCVRS